MMESSSDHCSSNILSEQNEEKENPDSSAIIKCNDEEAGLKVEEEVVSDVRQNESSVKNEPEGSSSTLHLMKCETKMEDSPVPNASQDSTDQTSSSQADSVNESVTSSQKSTLRKSRQHSDSDLSSTPPENKQAKLTPRTTRSSQNPDFAAKQRKFLNRVHDPIRRDNSDSENSQEMTSPISKSVKDVKTKSIERKSVGSNSAIGGEMKRKSERDGTPKRPADTEDECSSKKRRSKEPTKVVGGVDSYCWRCHRDGTVVPCQTCPRVYHLKCIQTDAAPPKGWMCPECSSVQQAENTDTRSRAMRMLSLDQLCNLLRFALNRMKNYEGAEDFMKAVDIEEFTNYREYIVKPMDLAQLERNIKNKMYGSTEAFLADAKWMLHDSIIFNSVQSKFSNTARSLLKICRQEMQEIENCPDCYQNAHTRASDSWFIEACRRPHLLVWAKLKGFPFWPAKAMSTNSENLVDVRFFGAHDRAWVPVSSCFLYSKLSPAPPSNKNKRHLEECLHELECHIKKLRDKFGQFEYPPYKTPYDPNNEEAQLALFLPRYEMRNSGKRSRMSLHQDGARKSLTQFKPSTEPPMKKLATQEEKPEEITPTKTSSPSGPKKSYRTPLTAAAKKCFESGEQCCIKCKVTIAGGKDISSSSLCSSCSSHQKSQRTKECCECRTNSCDAWHQGQSGLIYCDACFSEDESETYKVDVQLKKGDKANVSNVDVQETVTVQQKDQDTSLDIEEHSENKLIDSEDAAAAPEALETSVEEERESNMEEGRKEQESQSSVTGEVITNSDSPPTMVVSQSNGKGTPDSLKKVSIVDKLHEKLCFVVEEAIKSHIATDVGSESRENSPEIAETTEKALSPPEQKKVVQVLLHDLKNDKDMMDKIKETQIHSNKRTTDDIEVHTVTDSSSEADTDHSSLVESDTGVGNEDSPNKRKQKNINNVVNTLKERKSSVEEKIDQNDKSPTLKETSTLMLDDSNDEVPVLIIDEGDSNANEGKRAVIKIDKKRRKGTPAKVCSRSSTEGSENSVEVLRKSTSNKEVLDEVSGQFRRPSSETNMTITLVTDDESPQKKTKDLRSVNISKSLSLSVVNDSVASLDMECVESDDQVIVDPEIKKAMTKPTARKTLPNPPQSIDLPVLQEKGVRMSQSQETGVMKQRPNLTLVNSMSSPPPLLNIRPSPPLRTYIAKVQKPTEQPTPPAASTSTSSPPKETNIGPANEQLNEAVKKISGQIRSVVEQMLRNMSETGVNEATVKAMQIESERQNWRHRQEISELKHNTDLLVMEIRASLEADKQRALLDAKHKFDAEKELAVQETKRKQWCAFCQKEAQLYCCWNTSYCSYNCQQSHWVPHMNSCLNKQQGSNVEVQPRPAPPSRTQNYAPSGQPGFFMNNS